LAAVAFLTLFLYGAALMTADGEHLEGRGQGRGKVVFVVADWLAGWIGAKGVLILGGLFALPFLGWLVYAVVCPPTKIIVRPKGSI
jgi:hypothetical protein